jgi:hypothetical protein
MNLFSTPDCLLHLLQKQLPPASRHVSLMDRQLRFSRVQGATAKYPILNVSTGPPARTHAALAPSRDGGDVAPEGWRAVRALTSESIAYNVELNINPALHSDL